MTDEPDFWGGCPHGVVEGWCEKCTGRPNPYAPGGPAWRPDLPGFFALSNTDWEAVIEQLTEKLDTQD